MEHPVTSSGQPCHCRYCRYRRSVPPLGSRPARTQRRCAACGSFLALDDLQPVLAPNGEADLGTLLGGTWLCRDEGECLELTRLQGAGSSWLAVAVIPARKPGRTGGTVALITDDPRRAEEYAATVRGVTVRWDIHTDYREDR